MTCISGVPQGVDLIDQLRCIKCGRCFDVCRFDAVQKACSIERSRDGIQKSRFGIRRQYQITKLRLAVNSWPRCDSLATVGIRQAFVLGERTLRFECCEF